MRVASSLAALGALAYLAGAVSVGDGGSALSGSCPARGSSSLPGCSVFGTPTLADAAASDRPTSDEAAVSERKTASLIDQEITEVAALTANLRERISLLGELQGAIDDGLRSDSLPEDFPVAHARLLQDPMPPLRELTAREDDAVSGGTGDYMVSKVVLPQDEKVVFAKFLPLRNPRTAGPAPVTQNMLPSALLVAVQASGVVRLFTPTGDLGTVFSAGHDHPLQQVAVSPQHDEYLIATCDVRGLVRVHKVTVRSRRVTREERIARKAPTVDKVSQHLGPQLNVTVQLNRRFRLPNGTDGQPLALSAFVMASHQGTKYFLASDVRGSFTVFTRNGSRHAHFETGLRAPLDSLHVHVGSIVFASGGRWGFVDLDAMSVQLMACPQFNRTVTTAVVDTQQQARVLVADDEGYIWVFSVAEKRRCKIEHRFPRTSDQGSVQLGSVRGFALALYGGGSQSTRSVLTAINMSHCGKPRNDPARSVPATVWRRAGPPVRSWAYHRRFQQGDLLAMLSEDGLEIEIFELLLQVYVHPQSDNINNFKLPVFACAIVLVLGYQYVKGKGAFDTNLADLQ